jgi:thiamine pyrophosphate-dependent acetolactate synthase large subunit-like protein
MIQSSDQITSVLKQAFDTAGPVLVGVHVDYRDNHKRSKKSERKKCSPIADAIWHKPLAAGVM